MQEVYYTTSLTNAVHSKHRSAYIYSLKASFCSHHGSNRWATCWVILHNEILYRYSSILVRKFRNLSYNRRADAVRHVSLVCISFNDYSFMNSWSMLWMMFLWVVRMHAMRHVCWQHKAVANSSIIVLHLPLIAIDTLMNPLSYFSSHIRISSLSRLWAYFFVIKEHDHVDAGLIAIFLID
jgi:hypothetical protein